MCWKICTRAVRPSGIPTQTRAKATTVIGVTQPSWTNQKPSPMVRASVAAGCMTAPMIATLTPDLRIQFIVTSALLRAAASNRPKTSAVMPKFLTSLMPSTISTVTVDSSCWAAEYSSKLCLIPIMPGSIDSPITSSQARINRPAKRASSHSR